MDVDVVDVVDVVVVVVVEGKEKGDVERMKTLGVLLCCVEGKLFSLLCYKHKTLTLPALTELRQAKWWKNADFLVGSKQSKREY